MWRRVICPLVLAIGLLFDPTTAEAVSYYTPNKATRIDQPGQACLGRAVRYWNRRDVRVYVGTFYPRRLVLACKSGRPAAIISVRYENFKVNFDRMEACQGYGTMTFTNWGRNLKLDFVTTGAVRGMYCPRVGHRGTIYLTPHLEK